MNFWLIVFVKALIIICTAIFTYDVHLGMGKHIVNIPPHHQSLAVKVNLIANPFGIMAYSFPNISVAILLDRLLAPNAFRSRALYLLAISQCIIAAISCVLLFVQCLPTEFLWNPDPALKPRCFPPGTMSGYSYFVGCESSFKIEGCNTLTYPLADLTPSLHRIDRRYTRLGTCRSVLAIAAQS